MSGKVSLTPEDVMAELHAIKKAQQQLVVRFDDHDKKLEDHDGRLVGLESLRDSYRTLLKCNESIVRDLNGLKDKQDSLVETVARSVEGALRGDLLDLRRELRTDMAKIAMSNGALTEAQQQLTTILLDRPCVVEKGNGNCPHCGGDQG